MAAADRISGTLLGTALGDALGLAAEGMSARVIARRFGRVERFHMLGRTGFVSDDTEQAAPIAQSLAPPGRHRALRQRLPAFAVRLVLPHALGRGPGDDPRVRANWTRSQVHRRQFGRERSRDAGGDRRRLLRRFFGARLAFGRALAEVTHRDPCAVRGALYVSELAAACAEPHGTPAEICQEEARRCVTIAALGEAIDCAEARA